MARKTKCKDCSEEFEKDTPRRAKCPKCRELCSHCKSEPKLPYHSFGRKCYRVVMKRHWEKHSAKVKEAKRQDQQHGQHTTEVAREAETSTPLSRVRVLDRKT